MRILLVKTSSLGDVVHNLPVAGDLARRFPGVAIDWLVEAAFAEIPRLHPAIDRIIPVAVRRWRRRLLSPGTWREMSAFRESLRAEAYDAVLDTQGLLKSGLMTGQARLAPGGHRLGYSRQAAREPLAARFYDRTYTLPKNIHAVERNRWLAAVAFGYAEELSDLPLDYGLGAVAAADESSAPYAVLLTATSRDDKLWPEDAWLALAGALHGRGLRCVLPAGTDLERARAQRLAGGMADGEAAPPMGLTELAALLSGARLVVGVDTGLVHLAAALGRPTLALFCGSDPDLTGVHAGARAINLGRRGAPPSVAEAVATALRLLD